MPPISFKNNQLQMAFKWICPCGHNISEESIGSRNAAIRKHLAGQDWKLCWDSYSSLSWLTSKGRDDFVISEAACPLVNDVFGCQTIKNRENYLSKGMLNVGKTKKDYTGKNFKESITYNSECFCCGLAFKRVVSSKDNRWIKTATVFSVAFCNKCNKFAGFLRNNNALSCRSRDTASMFLAQYVPSAVGHNRQITVLSQQRARASFDKKVNLMLERPSSKMRQTANRFILHYMLWLVGNFVSHVKHLDGSTCAKHNCLNWRRNYVRSLTD